MKQFFITAPIMILNYLKNIPVKKTISLILFILGIVFICSGLFKMYENQINPNWPLVSGVVVKSVMDSNIITSNNNKISNTFYSSTITFKYQVRGRTYTNSTIVGKVLKNNPTIAEKTLKKYPEDQLVKICYDPHNPKDSLIKTFSEKEKWLLIIGGLLLIVLGLINSLFLKAKDKVKLSLSSRKDKSNQKPLRKTVNKKIYQVTPNNQALRINGKWILNYQIPSMIEIKSLIQKTSGTTKMNDDIISTGSDAIMLTITNEKMRFNYNNSGCEVLSKYWVIDDTLMLEHKRIDFSLMDIEDFPPRNYTWSLKGSTLILITNKIKGLDNRRITYHFSKSDSPLL